MQLILPRKKKSKVPDKTFTLTEIKTYLQSKDSITDALYHLSEKNILLVNTVRPMRPEPENFAE